MAEDLRPKPEHMERLDSSQEDFGRIVLAEAGRSRQLSGPEDLLARELSRKILDEALLQKPALPGKRPLDQEKTIEQQGSPQRAEPARLETFKLDSGVGRHKMPDALLYVNPDFNPKEKINLVIFNHGWASTVDSAMKRFGLAKQMADAPKNSILFMPEWQYSPGSESSTVGKIGSEHFSNMLNETLARMAQRDSRFAGLSLNNLDTVHLISHSAGYVPSAYILNSASLGPKVNNLTVLDSGYGETSYDKWINSNLGALVKGEKRMQVFYQDTAAESKGILNRLQQSLKEARLPNIGVLHEDENLKKVELARQSYDRYPVIFKHSHIVLGSGKNIIYPHESMVMLYVSTALQAADRAARARK